MKIHKRLLAGALVMLTGITLCGSPAQADPSDSEPVEKILAKSSNGNPLFGFGPEEIAIEGQNGIIYGGDPSIMVDGDTVYAYVGQDVSTGEYYTMPRWLCYSTTDMKEWKYESVIMTMQDVSWRNDDVSAWASQVVRVGDMYYFFYCAEGNGSVGRGKCIGAAISESPTGPFKDIGHPLVRNIDTPDGPHTWEDIDPTAWVEEDENGDPVVYVGWGNNRFFVCQVECTDTTVTIKDQDNNPDNLSVGYEKGNDIVIGKMNGIEIFNDQDKFEGHAFTEAPFYYRQQDEEGNYYGPYYMFFATDWREQMAYATTDDLMSNDWTFGGIIMEPSATANTNHMAVFDFKGETYFVYHDGSLPHGSGYRRVACIEKFDINEDGSIDPIAKTAVGLNGTVSTIKDSSGAFVANVPFENTLNDGDYPMTDWSTSSLTARGSKEIIVDFFQTGTEKEWEINPAKIENFDSLSADVNTDAYVSIESNNKPGLYMAAGNQASDGTIRIVLAQDAGGTENEAKRMSFRTLEGFAGEGVTFESVQYPGYYMVSRDGALYLEQDPDAEAATFYVSTEKGAVSGDVLKTTRLYTAGDELNDDDIRISVNTDDGKTETVTEYTTNADEIDMSTTGTKTLKVSYEYNGEQLEGSVTITVVDADYR